MAFDLEVTVTGLCVFVPQKQQMHILMVTPAAGGGHSDHQHYPRVFYDAAHDSQVGADKFWRIVPLDRTVLDLSGVGGDGKRGGELKDIKDIVDITEYTPELKDPTAPQLPGLISRVTLPLAKTIGSPDAKGKWELQRPNKPSKILEKAAWKVVWRVGGIAGTDLRLPLQAFTGEYIPVVPLAPLKPIAGVVKLFISNVTREESGPSSLVVDSTPPKGGTKMPHFEAFRDLYAGSGTPANPWPDLVYTGATAQRGTPYTCLPSGGH